MPEPRLGVNTNDDDDSASGQHPAGPVVGARMQSATGGYRLMSGHQPSRIADWIRSDARNTPGRACFVTETDTYSFSQVNSRVNFPVSFRAREACRADFNRARLDRFP